MRKKIAISYLLVCFAIVITLSLSKRTSEKIRGEGAALVTPLWEKTLSLKAAVMHPLQDSPFESLNNEEKIDHLLVENKLLRNEKETLQSLLNEQLIFTEKSEALPARVIFRTLDQWNSALWINVGEATNRAAGEVLVARGSPVVSGQAIVGIVDNVEENASRVLLISDSRLRLSVRAARGGEQERALKEQIERTLQAIESCKVSSLPQGTQDKLLTSLKETKEHLDTNRNTSFLAKGELLGAASPTKLSMNTPLKGTGFNFEFSDDAGERRDLRSGKTKKSEKATPILKVGDILVTTGMDGLFPPGFQVATVTHVNLLKEGDVFFELLATPIAGPLDALSMVFVLPPVKGVCSLSLHAHTTTRLRPWKMAIENDIYRDVVDNGERNRDNCNPR